jgi:hypothetical protein
MVAAIQILRSLVSGNRPASRQYGEPYVNFADNQFGVVNSSNVATDLLGVTMFSTGASYVSGNVVNYQGKLYQANTSISPGAWNASQWAQLSAGGAVVVGGILKYVSATALSFTPYKSGNNIIINGIAYPIPSGGIAGLANTSVFVNGTAGQNLAANTNYYVYAFNNSGTITADFSTTTHATSTTAGNVGTEIKSGDDTRSLIGFIRTSGTSFADSASLRFVRSWFNDGGVSGMANFSATRSQTNTTFAEVHTEIRNQLLLWAGEKVWAVCSGTTLQSVGGNANYGGFGIDSATVAETASRFSTIPAAAGAYNPFSLNTNKSGLAEGFHYVTLLGFTSGGTASWIGASDATYLACCALQTMTLKA